MAQSEDAEPPSMEENADKPASKTSQVPQNDNSETITTTTTDEDKTNIKNHDDNNHDSQIIENANDTMIEDETMPSLTSITSFSSAIILSKQDESDKTDCQIKNDVDQSNNIHNDNKDDDNIVIQTISSSNDCKTTLPNNHDIDTDNIETKPLATQSKTINPKSSIKSVPQPIPISQHNFQQRKQQEQSKQSINIDVVSQKDDDTQLVELSSGSDSEIGEGSDNDDDDDDDDDSINHDEDIEDEEDEQYDPENEINEYKYNSEEEEDKFTMIGKKIRIDEIDSDEEPTESIEYDNENDRSDIDDDDDDDDDYDGCDKFDQTSHDGSMRHGLYESLTENNKERSKSLQDLCSPEKARSNSNNKRKYHHIHHQDILIHPKKKLQQTNDPLSIDYSKHGENNEININHELLTNNKEEKEEISQNNIVIDETLIDNNVLHNRLIKNNINLIPVMKKKQQDTHLKVSNKELNLANNVVDDDDDDDIIIDDQPSNNDEKSEENQIKIPHDVTKKSQNFTIQPTSYQDYMLGNTSVATTKFVEKNYPSNDDEEIENIIMEVDNSTQLHSQINLKIDDVMSLGAQKINNQIVDKIDDSIALAYETRIEQLIEENESLTQELIDCENHYKKKLSTLHTKYTTENDKNISLKNKINDLEKLLENAEKKIKTLVNNEKKMTDFTVQTEINQDIQSSKNLNKTNMKLTLNDTSIESSTINTSEQWSHSAGDSYGSPVISLKTPNVDDLLSNTNNSFIAGGPTINKPTNKQLSNAFFTSSRILETLANITQGKTDPAKSQINNIINNNNSDNVDNSTTSIPRNQVNNQGQFNNPLTVGNGHDNINKTTSRKRKAESPLINCSDDHDDNCPPPFKIPSLIPDQYRRSFNSSSHVDDAVAGSGGSAAMKKNVDQTSKINKKMNETSTSEEIVIGDGIKCFVYHENDDSEERSFLIQAEEPLQMPNNKAVVRQCGPFMLKNIEVRMSEVNGTINIWGKEIKTDSPASNPTAANTTTGIGENFLNFGDDIDDYEDEEDENDNDIDDDDDDDCTLEFNNHNKFWKQTPSKNISSPFLCSTSRKMMPPSSRASLASTTKRRISRDSFDRNQNQHQQRLQQQRRDQIINHFGSMPNLDYNTSPLNHQQFSQQQRQKFLNSKYVNKPPSNLRSKSPYTNQSYYESKMNNDQDCLNYDNEYDNILSETNYSNDIAQSKQHDYLRQSNSSDSGYIPGVPRTNQHRASPIESIYLGDNDPLIRNSKNSSLSDIKQHRLRGKRVKGILMDFIKGCGPCKNPHSTTTHEHYRQTETMSVPNIRITPATSGRSSCKPSANYPESISSSSRQQDSYNNSRAKRINVADLEKQIQMFQDDMEKMRSRSNAFLDMLQLLQGMDSN